MKINNYNLLCLIITAVAFLTSCAATPVKIVDLRDVCDALPDMRSAGKSGLKDVVVEGYITGREPGSGVKVEGSNSTKIYIAGEIDAPNENMTGATIDIGDKSNQIQIIENKGYKIKDDSGEVLNPKDKVRVYLSIGNVKYPQYNICTIYVLKITKL